jgi:Type II secretion system (T2SS), protein E, N-terminal domain
LADDALRTLSAHGRLAYLAAEDLPPTLPLIKHLSPKYLRQYVACPVAVEGTVVHVAIADPTNPLLLDELRQTLGGTVTFCVAPAEAILAAIARTCCARQLMIG